MNESYERERKDEREESMNKRKWMLLGGAGVVVVAAVIVLIAILGGNNDGRSADRVFVESVASIMAGNTGSVNRFTGIVEPERTLDINRNPDGVISEIFVSVGDEVEEGAALFEYDTSSLQQQIAMDELALEEMGNQITDFQNQIATLQREMRNVPADQRFQYTTQIQSLETSIKQVEFNIQSKNIEIERNKNTVANSVITSEIAGIVRSISETGFDPNTGQPLPFMNILALGEVRVRGRVNEQNIWDLQPEMSVIIRSRVSDEMLWNGSISEIDTTPVEEGNNMWGGPDMPSATNYNFFVTVADTTDLLIGQHVFIELDHGQSEEREGIWLFEGYIEFDGDSAYVWADNGRGRLERRQVELGEYEANLGDYQILSGLTLEDYITFPMPGLYEGVRTVTNQDEVDFSSPLYNNEDRIQEEWPGGLEDVPVEHPGDPGEDGAWGGEMSPGEVPIDHPNTEEYPTSPERGQVEEAQPEAEVTP